MDKSLRDVDLVIMFLYKFHMFGDLKFAVHFAHADVHRLQNVNIDAGQN